MRFGVTTFLSSDTIGPAELGAELEARGLDALFLQEHTHTTPGTVHPKVGPIGTEMERHIAGLLDPFVALAAAATATTRLVVGTGVCLLPQHDAISLAKTVATLDHLSAGRVVLGIGCGWNRPEMLNHRIDPDQRWRAMAETVEAMCEIWSHDVASFDGTIVRFENVMAWPKPVQRPHPPFVLGGDGPKLIDRIVAYGDGWMPSHGYIADVIPARVAELRARFAELGRTPEVHVTWLPSDRRVVERYAHLGVDTAIFLVPAGSRDEMLRSIDACAEVALSFSSPRSAPTSDHCGVSEEPLTLAATNFRARWAHPAQGPTRGGT